MPDCHTTERRSHRRYRLKECLHVFIRTRPAKLGQLVDISSAGLAFRFLADDQGVTVGPHRLDIMSSEGDIYLRELPVTMVAERVEDSLPFASIMMRIAAMEFGELTTEQRRQLNEILSRGKSC